VVASVLEVMDADDENLLEQHDGVIYKNAQLRSTTMMHVSRDNGV
jgi:hypothetical protein